MLDVVKLQKSLEILGIYLSPVQQQQLIAYAELLVQWNSSYNLVSAIINPDDLLTKHLIDSLSTASHISGDNLLDVGTGAGLPGIPLAICYPEKKITLVDRSGKKIHFLLHVTHKLGLANVTARQQDVINYATEKKYAVITARAVSSLATIINLSSHLLAENGYFLFMKGKYPAVEISVLPSGWGVEVVPIHLPFIDSARHLIKGYRTAFS